MTNKSQNKPGRYAVIYCRVSSRTQVEEGHGLESQEARCREYAVRKGYEVVQVFYESAVSGGVADRPSFNAMLGYLKALKGDGAVVVIDDISRFARDIEGHWALKHALKQSGGTLESPSITFGENSDSIFVENVLASVHQHQRQKNGEQTKNRMRARCLNGYWVFHAPAGYRYEKTPAHGKLLVRDEPLASIIQEALEGFASARLETQAEVKRFLEAQPAFPKDRRTGEVRYEEVVRLMRRPHYAGYIELLEWDVSLRKGHHEGLISLETFNRIQKRLKDEARAPVRKDISADFPLRGFVLCASCDNPLTASWSKSKTGKYHPYYMCFSKGCDAYRKSIRRDDLEGAFGGLIKGFQPTRELYDLARVMFEHAWTRRLRQRQDRARALKDDCARIEREISALLERTLSATHPKVIATYEARLVELEREKVLAAEKMEKGAGPQRPFGEMFELACRFLASPWKL
jgi:site-specific DNA recombinase